MAGDWERERMRPPRHMHLKVALLLGAVVVVGVLARWGEETPSTGGTLDVEPELDESPAPRPRPTPRPTPARRPTPSPEPSAAGTLSVSWEQLPAGPAPVGGEYGREPALAWDGRRLFVFGGQTWDDAGEQSELHDSAWLLDTQTGDWTELPAGPLEARVGAGAAWTGEEFVVWGGMGRDRLFADGAAYEPARRRWRVLADSPLSPRQGSAVVWTDGGLLVAGGVDNAGGLVEAATYDPRADRWLRIPDVPVASPTWGIPMGAVRTGEGAVVWFPEFWGPGRETPLEYAGGAWSALAELPARPDWSLVMVASLPDDGLVALRGGWGVRGMEGSLVTLPPGATEWREVADVPLRADDRLHAVSFGWQVVVVDGRSGGAVFDLLSESWFELADVPRLGEPWTLRGFPLDDGVVIYGSGMGPGSPATIVRMTLDARPDGAR